MPFKQPFQMFGIDIKGPLPCSNKGNKYIIVAIDYGSKWCICRAIKDYTAQTTANLIAEEIIFKFSVPKQILNDHGTNFQDNLIRRLFKAFKIEKLNSSVYHTEGNGLVERQNRTLKSMLACNVHNNHSNWDFILQAVAFAYNTLIHSTTGYSTYEIIYGKKPINLASVKFNVTSNQIYTDSYLNKLEMNRSKLLDEIRKQILNKQKSQKKLYDKHVNDRKIFKINDLVMIVNTNTKTGETKKFENFEFGTGKGLSCNRNN